jgi:glycine betaine/proline transport system substrate-binding protein
MAVYLSAYEKVNFTTEMISYASSLYVIEQKPEQPAIDAWLAKYGEQSQAWLAFTCPTE